MDDDTANEARHGGSAPGDDRLHLLLERLCDATERIAAVLEKWDSKVEAPAKNSRTSSSRPVAQTPQVASAVAPEPIRQFLEARGIRIQTVPQPEPRDEVIDSLSEFLGSRYSALRETLALIKQRMQATGSFSQRLEGRPAEEISSICQFCHRLHELAFLSDYRYRKSPRFLLHATVSSSPVAQRFFSGQWLERYILIAARRLIESAFPSAFHCWLLNPQVILPNGTNFEFDVLVWIEGELFWIEAKTGEYQQYVEKYSRVARLMEPNVHPFMVLTEVAPPVCEHLSSLFRMRVCNLEMFAEHFARELKRLNGGGSGAVLRDDNPIPSEQEPPRL